MILAARRASAIVSVIAGVLLTVSQPGLAQKKASPPATSPEHARQVLIANARALESRGRPDMALQIWQQILLSDPNNAEALAGLARDYKLTGATKDAEAALDKLRRANPSDPNIAKIQSLNSTRTQNDQLRKAGELARQGKNEDAMRIYRELYGDRPPDGDIALAYYQTLYGTASGKQDAIAAMRALALRNPGDSRYTVELGRMLSYDVRTRAEGIRILQQYPKDAEARSALRQALVWNAANPASAADLRKYLKEHPQDVELGKYLKENEEKLAQMNAGIARTPEERAAFAALSARRFEDAEKRFMGLLQKDPANPRAAAGMGFLRMQQGNFGGAISYLTEAEQNGYKASTVEKALATSRFWYTMGEASHAFDVNQVDVAARWYKEALAMQPKSPEALLGYAGVLVKTQQYAQAAGVYEQLLSVQPRSSEGWRGVFLSQARDGQMQAALATASKFPPTVKAAMARDPEYLRTLAGIYQAQGRPVEAQRVLSQALALPFPDEGAHLKQETRLQYAGILMEAHRFDQAAALYNQILNDDPSNMPAWMGLVSAHHQLGRDADAILDVEKMPPPTYEAALNDAGFLSMLGAIYQKNNKLDVAQNLLERAIKLQQAAGGQPSVPSQVQLAGIYLQRNNTAQAYAIYRQVLNAHPDRLDAWKGLLAAMLQTQHINEGLQQLAYIPPAVKTQLEADPEFVQTEASIYAAAGDVPHATQYMQRVQQYYARNGGVMPADLAIQNAWLLYNTRNDAALYPALMKLGSRQDLTAPQRETVQTVWANWAVRRAGAAFDSNDNDRAVEILEAAALAFPDNVEVRRILAAGYLRVGRARDSLNLYKQLSMDSASAADYQGVIGAALAANDRSAAELYLRQALDRFPNDYHILGMAAKYEQARGDKRRAADYWRAAIAAMPPGSPTDRLAHDLAYPDVSTKTHKAMTAGDLQRLLDPAYAAQNEPFPKVVKLPPLPGYGPDPYLGRAPVIPESTQPSTIAQQTQIPSAPPTTIVQEPLPAPTPRNEQVRSGEAAPSTSGTQSVHRRKKKAGPPSDYSGQMHLPESEENITSTEPAQQPSAGKQSGEPVWIPSQQPTEAAPASPAPSQPAGAPQWTPVVPSPQASPRKKQGVPPEMIPPTASVESPGNAGPTRLHLSAEPMDSRAAQIQTMFADQTDRQLTQGYAAVRPLANNPVLPPSSASAPANGEIVATRPADYSGVQYTPSAQEAAAGAYSAQRQPPQGVTAPPPTPVQPDQKQAKPKPANKNAQPAVQGGKTAKKKGVAPSKTVPTLVTAPAEQSTVPPEQAPAPGQQAQQPAPGGAANPDAGISDQELQQQNLPPLRGPWVKVRREPRAVSPREEAEQQLQSLESSYSAWIGGTGIINYRSGDQGYDRLAALEAPFEWSAPLGYHARVSVIARPVFLDSGQADGTSVLTVQEFPTTGRTLVTIPQPLGTATNTGPTTGSTTFSAPAQQNASGIGGEVQLAFPNLTLAAGYTPFGFLVRNGMGRAQWRPANGPFTFSFLRDSVKDTQLSYAGLRDPGEVSLSYPGSVWGGVIANQGSVQYARGDALSGFYVAGGGQYITGYRVRNNHRIDGTGGAYWRVWTQPEYGNLTVGLNFFAMHYANYQGLFTRGMGGYFSPQAYFLANVPFTWQAHSGTRWHYEVLGGIGVQAFQRDKTLLFPMAAQRSLEIGLNNAALPALTSVGANYNLRSLGSYQIGPHWFAGGFLSANNTRNYNSVSVGFSIHYVFRAQPSTVATPTGLFPADGLRPFTVP